MQLTLNLHANDTDSHLDYQELVSHISSFRVYQKQQPYFRRSHTLRNTPLKPCHKSKPHKKALDDFSCSAFPNDALAQKIKNKKVSHEEKAIFSCLLTGDTSALPSGKHTHIDFKKNDQLKIKK